MSQRRTENIKRKSPGNIYDAFIKKMFGRILVFASFLNKYGDPEFVKEIDLDNIQPAPTHYFGKDGDERILDLLFECPFKDGDGTALVVIVFEHQGGSLRNIVRKLLKYISAFWEAEVKAGKKTLSAPYFLVLRTGKKPRHGLLPQINVLLPKNVKGKRIGNNIIVDYDVVDLPAWDSSDLIGIPELRLTLGIVKKMTEGNDDEFPEALRPLLEIKDYEQKVELTKDMLNFVAQSMQAHNRRLDIQIANEALKLVFDEKEVKNMIPTIFEEKFLEGVAKGKAEGIAKGKAEGIAEGKAETLFTVLNTRFKRVPKVMQKKMSTITDLKTLDFLTRLAVTCENLKEFENALN